jgi:hypothetical protein
MVSDTQRNGSIAGIAVVLGFSLNFTATWSQGPEPWSYRAIPIMVVAAVGIVLQLSALLRVLSIPVLTGDQHRGAGAKFFWGVVLVLLAFAVHVAFDMAHDLTNAPAA